MICVEVDFIITEPQVDGSDRYIHSVKGWAKSDLDRHLKTLIRECTNIRDSLEIVAFRELDRPF
jgi:hypothetical protein